MILTATITKQEIQQYYSIGRDKAHAIWLGLLLFRNKDDEYIHTKNDFAAYINVDIREVLFYFYSTNKGVIEMYENYLNANIANEKKLNFASEISIPKIPTEMELEVEFMLNKLKIIPEDKLKAKKVVK